MQSNSTRENPSDLDHHSKAASMSTTLTPTWSTPRKGSLQPELSRSLDKLPAALRGGAPIPRPGRL